MKSHLACTGLLLSVCLTGMAQDTGNRVVVPARNTTHPRVVNCSVLNSSITVKTHSGNDVIVEEAGSSSSRRSAPDGMRRLDAAARGLEVVEEDNVITIHRRPSGGNLIVTVPVETSLRLRTLSGEISVDGVHGEIEAHTQNGHVTMANISGTVSADSQNGAIKVAMSSVDGSKPLAFSTFNGAIDLTFPPDLKANLTVKSNHGPVYSDYDVTLGGNRAVTEKNGSSDGKFRIRIDNTIRGSINGGGVDLTVRTYNGGVYLRKKK